MKRYTSHSVFRALVVGGAFLGTLSAAPADVEAHSESIHQQMVHFAWDVLRLTRDETIADLTPVPDPLASTPPPGASAAEWNAFLADAAASVMALARLPAGERFPGKPACQDAGFNFQGGAALLGELDFPPNFNYRDQSGCETQAVRPRPGIFAGLPADNRDNIGMGLGMVAAAVDAEHDDTVMWWRPTAPVLGNGPVSDVTSRLKDAAATALIPLLLPLACAAEYFTDPDCFDNASTGARHLVESGDLIRYEGLIPGVVDVNIEGDVGFWHHIHMEPCATNLYNDIQGIKMSEAGPGCIPGAFDVAISVASNVGITLNYDKSNGPKRYQFTDDDDGHSGIRRDKAQWQRSAIGYLEFEPLDNLAWFGWNQYRSDRVAYWLGWPLHALADATVPHHTVASGGHGHHPFEEQVLESWVGEEGMRRVADGNEEFEQVRRILQRAFEYRQMVLDFRAENPGRPFANDVPIRDLVTAVAARTRAYSLGLGDPFFNDLASTLFWGGSAVADLHGVGGNTRDISIEMYAHLRPLIRPLIEDGTAAIVAFLISASESVLPVDCIPEGGTCDKNNPLPADNCCNAAPFCGTPSSPNISVCNDSIL